MREQNLEKAAQRGVPSQVWRDGQERRLQMILDVAGGCTQGTILENGCGVGLYVEHLQPYVGKIIGLEYDYEHVRVARSRTTKIIRATSEQLPFPTQSFDLILSHEVIEHVQDDQAVIREMVRALRPGGRIVLFCPNRGYPFETHGIYWLGKYKFGNIPLVNYLPRKLRDRLAPHVNIYTGRDLARSFEELPVRLVKRTVIFGAYDNIIARSPALGRTLRRILQWLEKTPLRVFGLSHFWVIEKI